MLLFHYTSGRCLRGIARFGLTVGDVPTDIRHGKGRVGVWLTSAETGGGHGLESAAVDKTEYQLSVDIPDDAPQLVRWTDWSAANATPETIGALTAAAAEHEGVGPSSWYIFFGVLSPDKIVRCVRTSDSLEIPNWGEASPPETDIKAVPAWRRDAWHRQLLKKVERALKHQQSPRVVRR